MALGRPVKVPLSYLNDAGYLTRLMERLEKDTGRPAKWRAKVSALLADLVKEFTTAPNGAANDS